MGRGKSNEHAEHRHRHRHTQTHTDTDTDTHTQTHSLLVNEIGSLAVYCTKFMAQAAPSKKEKPTEPLPPPTNNKTAVAAEVVEVRVCMCVKENIHIHMPAIKQQLGSAAKLLVPGKGALL